MWSNNKKIKDLVEIVITRETRHQKHGPYHGEIGKDFASVSISLKVAEDFNTQGKEKEIIDLLKAKIEEL